MYRKVVDNLEEGVMIISTDYEIVYINQAVEKIGINHELTKGKRIFDVFPNLKIKNSNFVKVMETKKPILNYLQTFITNDNKEVTAYTSTYPILNRDEVIGAFEIFQDFSAVKKLNDRIMNLYEEQQLVGERKKIEQETNIFLGNDEKILEIKKILNLYVKSTAPLLIIGETGTGKEVVVKYFHELVGKDVPLVSINCATIPENLLESTLFGTEKGAFTGAIKKKGLVEMAENGLFFLDEIDSLSLELQAKLLRLIQEKKFRRVGANKEIQINVRIVASTNSQLEQLINEKKFRKDLFYRLNVLNVHLPPLKERKKDIPILVSYFLKYYSEILEVEQKNISKEGMNLLINHDWPGNIRELKNMIERLVTVTTNKMIKAKDIKFENMLVVKNFSNEYYFDGHSSLKERVEEYERSIILQALKKENGNISKAANNLKVPQQTLSNKIKKYNLKERSPEKE